MKEYILLMHADVARATAGDEWEAYFGKLRASGCFEGGSAVGDGECLRKSGAPGPRHDAITGYLKITAKDLSEAKSLVLGNPVYEAGGTVEVRELPRS